MYRNQINSIILSNGQLIYTKSPNAYSDSLKNYFDNSI